MIASIHLPNRRHTPAHINALTASAPSHLGFPLLGSDTFSKHSQPLSAPVKTQGGVVFGIRRPQAKPLDPFEQKAQVLLNEWAQWKGVVPSALPKVVIDETGQHIPLMGGAYVSKDHTLYLNKKVMLQMGMSLETMVPHEATHAWYALCRTRLKARHPNVYKATCLEWVKEDTLFGDKTAIALQLNSNELSNDNIQLIQRPYIPSKPSRQRVADTLERLIRTKAYTIQEGQATLSPVAEKQLDTLLAQIPDYTEQLTHGVKTQPYQSHWEGLGKGLIKQYLEAQLIRYDHLVNHSTFDPALLPPTVVHAPLQQAEREAAIASMKDQLRTIESSVMTQMAPNLLVNSQYPGLNYTAGNIEEYQAYRAQNEFLRHLLDHPDSAMHPPENLRNRETLEHTLQLLDAAKDYSQAVRQFNALPRRPDIEAMRIGHLINIPLMVQTLEFTQERSGYMRTPKHQRQAATTLTQQIEAIQTALRDYNQHNDPVALMAPSPQKRELLKTAKTAAERVKALNQKPHYLNKALLPLFAFPNIEAYQAQVLEHAGVQQHMAETDALNQATSAPAMGLAEFIVGSSDPDYMLSYKSGF